MAIDLVTPPAEGAQQIFVRLRRSDDVVVRGTRLPHDRLVVGRVTAGTFGPTIENRDLVRIA